MTLDVQGVNLITPLLGDMPDLESLSLRRFNTVLAGLLDRCSAIVFDKPAKQIRLTCG